jgi:hypothetical protein
MRTSSNPRLAGMIIASALAFVGCVSSHVTEQPDAHVEGTDGHVSTVDAHVTSPDAHVDIDAAVPLECLAAGEMGCASTERACCEGTYCQMGGYVVQYDTCLVLATDGEACNYPSECASGRCESGMCRSAECASEGGECFAAFASRSSRTDRRCAAPPSPPASGAPRTRGVPPAPVRRAAVSERPSRARAV